MGTNMIRTMRMMRRREDLQNNMVLKTRETNVKEIKGKVESSLGRS
jgi:hypothetical protein